MGRYSGGRLLRPGMGLVYALTLEHTAYGRDSLSARMNVYREVWVRRMLDREARMVDMQIMGALQNGTAFFASTSLIAVGGATGAAAGDQRGARPCSGPRRSASRPRRRCGSTKCVGLSYFRLRVLQIRLVVPAVQLCFDPARRRHRSSNGIAAGAEAHVIPHHETVRGRGPAFQPRPARVLLCVWPSGWFVSPWVLFVTTAAVVIVPGAGDSP